MVNKKTGKRTRHIPQRTCVGCKAVLPKRNLIRIVRTPEGVVVDPGGKANGRGAYLHDHLNCWEQGLKGSLAHALKTNLTVDEINILREFAAKLPEETD